MKEHILIMLQKRARVSCEIAGTLIEYPHSMDGDSQKEQAYQVAIQYFVEKQKYTKAIGEVSYNNRNSLTLQTLVESYTEEEGEKKQEYAKKIARMLVETQEYYLMRIPDEIKEKAFPIAIQYLKELMCA